jgi:hypothetical protein
MFGLDLTARNYFDRRAAEKQKAIDLGAFLSIDRPPLRGLRSSRTKG